MRLLRLLAAAGEVAGIHVEGPFLAARRCGAQDPAALLPADRLLTQRLADEAGGHLMTMTLAPELPGVRDAGGEPGCLAGGTAFLLDAVRSAATTPAEVLGDVTLGALEAGRAADLIATDGALRRRGVWRAGLPVPSA